MSVNKNVTVPDGTAPTTRSMTPPAESSFARAEADPLVRPAQNYRRGPHPLRYRRRTEGTTERQHRISGSSRPEATPNGTSVVDCFVPFDRREDAIDLELAVQLKTLGSPMVGLLSIDDRTAS